jgi:hypothetical protein
VFLYKKKLAEISNLKMVTGKRIMTLHARLLVLLDFATRPTPKDAKRYHHQTTLHARLPVLFDLATRPPPKDATRNIAIAIRSNTTTTKCKIARITCDYDTDHQQTIHFE